jgi:hypothetical protein
MKVTNGRMAIDSAGILPYTSQVLNRVTMDLNKENYLVENEDDEWITRCVIDPVARTFRLLSSEGDEKIVDCETVEQFMNVLEVVRALMPEKIIAYVDP